MRRFLLIFLCLVFSIQIEVTEGGSSYPSCITSDLSLDGMIDNDLNTSAILSSSSPKADKLEIASYCFFGSADKADFKTIVSGDLDCVQLQFLFVNLGSPSCRLTRSCEVKNLFKFNGNSYCLMTCPKVEDSAGGYEVYAMSGMTSDDLEIRDLRVHLDSNCVPNPCKNNGQCLEHEHSLTCRCVNGYSGITCEEPNACATQPCQNGGICVYNINTGGYRCNCPVLTGGVTCEIDCTTTFCAPDRWTGPTPVVYYPFQTEHNIGNKGAVIIDGGKVGRGLRSTKEPSGYGEIVIGTSAEVCMLAPSSCGELTGGAASFWVYPVGNGTSSVAITTIFSTGSALTEGFMVTQGGSVNMFHNLEGQAFFYTGNALTEETWTHFVVSFSAHDGLFGYANGNIHGETTTATAAEFIGNTLGKIVVGADFQLVASNYIIDELILFNNKLTKEEAQALYLQHIEAI